MMKKKRYLVLLILFLSNHSTAQKNILLVNGFVHVGNEKTIETGTVGIRNGKISLVRNSLAYSYSKEEWDTIIDLKGQHVYPAFVAGNTTLGLTEIDAVRATLDFEEVGRLNPHVRSQIAYNVESKVIATVRSNGVLLTQATPRGEVISGTSSMMATAGWNWEDATIKADDGIHVNWPNCYEYKRNEGELSRSGSYEQKLEELHNFFGIARAYGKQNESKDDIRLNAMTACFTGQKRVYFHADDVQQLLDIIDFSAKYQIAFPVIVGGYESYLIARKLKDAKIPVMLNRIHSLPENEHEPVDLPYRLPKLLQDGGVNYCIQPHGDMEAMNARNLPFLAGTAWAHGLTEEQAVASISKNVCDITGIGKDFGTIEEGKSATLIVSRGNALDMRSHHVTIAFLNGKTVDLSNSQDDLYQRYLKKYEKTEN